MTGYTKLFGSIIASTIWSEDDKTRIVWITMLAMANQHGEVESSIPGLASFAKVSVDAVEAALAKLKAPDIYSRTKEHEGRRIEDIDGGWFILNHDKYRKKASDDDRREQTRIRVQRHRSCNAVVTQSNEPVTQSNGSVTESNSKQRQKQNQKQKNELGDGGSNQQLMPAEAMYWNENCQGLPKVLAWSGGRQRALAARLKDAFWVANYRLAVPKMAKSAFCNGANDRQWVATLDFLLQSDSIAKVMEGKYDDRLVTQPARYRGPNI